MIVIDNPLKKHLKVIQREAFNNVVAIFISSMFGKFRRKSLQVKSNVIINVNISLNDNEIVIQERR